MKIWSRVQCPRAVPSLLCSYNCSAQMAASQRQCAPGYSLSCFYQPCLQTEPGSLLACLHVSGLTEFIYMAIDSLSWGLHFPRHTACPLWALMSAEHLDTSLLQMRALQLMLCMPSKCDRWKRKPFPMLDLMRVQDFYPFKADWLLKALWFQCLSETGNVLWHQITIVSSLMGI